MPKNYLIGIGGTGARVIESVVQACAAGLGPDELGVFIVDPDEGNGNLSDTKALLAEYEACRNALRERSGGNPMFRTEISSPPELVWGIFSKQNHTLERFLSLANLRQQRADMADFVSVLFSRSELETELNEGFRGHPSIGAVAMSSSAMDAGPWQKFWADIAGCQMPHEAKVFLVGSIFGGTGAAGVPTFGAREMIKFRAAVAAIDKDQSKVLLGGALVLPYFSFEIEPTLASQQAMFVTPSDFPMATRSALEFYETKELAFDQLYLIGDSLAQKVGDFSPGSKLQNNRPHYVELATALAVFDFFAQTPPPAGAPAAYFAAARESRAVDWDSLPVTRETARLVAGHLELKLRSAAMATCAYALAGYGDEKLKTPHEDVRDAWYRDHFDFNTRHEEERPRDPRHGANLEEIRLITAFGLKYLQWLAEMSADADVHLVNPHKIFSGHPPALVSYVEHPGDIGSIVQGSQSAGLNFDAFLTGALNEQKITNDSMRAGDRWINLFYGAAVQFCRNNYGI